MKTSQQIGIAGVLIVCLSACGSNPPKPVLPDGSHRIPVNATPAVSSTASPAASVMSATASGAQS